MAMPRGDQLSRQWRLLHMIERPHGVVFARPLAPDIRERRWHPSQKLVDLADGRREMTLQVADTLEVRRWILGYRVQAEVLEPASLREALGAEAETLATKLAPQRAPLAVARGNGAVGGRTRTSTH